MLTSRYTTISECPSHTLHNTLLFGITTSIINQLGIIKIQTLLYDTANSSLPSGVRKRMFVDTTGMFTSRYS
ncbi:hypothetical protein CGG94_08160 [Vibrio parahaemolyticus]|nr:hypothetical protein CGG94_08160 [Vibrio parahaemolyticus]